MTGKRLLDGLGVGTWVAHVVTPRAFIAGAAGATWWLTTRQYVTAAATFRCSLEQLAVLASGRLHTTVAGAGGARGRRVQSF